MRAHWFLNLPSEARLCELTSSGWCLQRQVHTTQTATLLSFSVAGLGDTCPSSDSQAKLLERRGRTNQKQQPLLPCTLVRELLISTGFFSWFCLFPSEHPGIQHISFSYSSTFQSYVLVHPLHLGIPAPAPSPRRAMHFRGLTFSFNHFFWALLIRYSQGQGFQEGSAVPLIWSAIFITPVSFTGLCQQHQKSLYCHLHLSSKSA